MASYTTMNLGGNARYFTACATVQEVKQALEWAQTQPVPIHILGGGSNTIFADDGFPGLVIKIELKGVQWQEEVEYVTVTAAAGEVWDSLVVQTIDRGCAGFECLSGIPGSVGATPMQNVGAYGQDVSATVTSVTAIDRTTLTDVTFTNQECVFRYRGSRFKYEDAGRYVITAVRYRLRKSGPPTLKYPELVELIGGTEQLATLKPGREQLTAVRTAVLILRRRKSMVLDPSDSNTRSCGSFFVNTVLTPEQFVHLQTRWQHIGDRTPIPAFPAGANTKVPSAWLIEKAGFAKGQRHGGVGISSNHLLALVNYAGTTTEILSLAAEIEAKVFTTFGITLQREPDIIGVTKADNNAGT